MLIGPLGSRDLGGLVESQELCQVKYDHHSYKASGQFYSVVLQPRWVHRVALLQHTALDFAIYQQLDYSATDDSFEYRQLNDCKVWYLTVGTHVQLILPCIRGYKELIFKELYASKAAGRMGTQKTMATFSERVWWSKILGYVKYVIGFYQVCQCIKTFKNYVKGLFLLLSIPEHRFKSISLDNVNDLLELRLRASLAPIGLILYILQFIA